MTTLPQADSFSGNNLYFEHDQKCFDTPRQVKSEICKDQEKFYQLANEWNLLLQHSSANNVFLTWEWISIWWRHHYQNMELYVVTVRDPSNQLIGIAPLAIKNVCGMTGHMTNRHLVFLGQGTAAPDHLDFIVHRDHEDLALPILIEELTSHRPCWDQISLEGIKANSAGLSLFLEKNRHPNVVTSTQICPRIDLPSDWETQKKSFSRSMRYNLGRFKRNLEKDYPIVTRFKQAENLDEYLPRLFELHGIAQRRKHNPGLFSEPVMQEFHTDIAKAFMEKGWLRAYTLNVGRNTVAALHCFQYNDTVSFYQSGFDLFWRKYSPGTLIMAHALEQAINEKNRVFDFLRGTERYKSSWTNTQYVDLNLSVPISFQNQIKVHFKHQVRKIKRQYFQFQ